MSDKIDISRKALEAVMMSLPAGPWMARGRVHSQSMRVWGTTNPTHTNHGVSPDDFIIADISRGAQCAATASFIAQSREMILALRAALDRAEADKAAAVGAMREACAALVDCGGCVDHTCCNPVDCNAMIAAAIRAIPTPPALPASPEVQALVAALRNIAEGNLGPEPWQADYAKIKAVAVAALALFTEAKP